MSNQSTAAEQLAEQADAAIANAERRVTLAERVLEEIEESQAQARRDHSARLEDLETQRKLAQRQVWQAKKALNNERKLPGKPPKAA